MAIDFPSEIEGVRIFDTNSYRRLAHNASDEEAVRRATDLVASERGNHIQAIASPVVLLELLAHLGDPVDPSYANCKAAVCAAERHCRMALDSGGTHIAIAPSTDLQLCISLTGEWPEALVHNDDLIRAIALRVSEDPSEQALGGFREDLREVSRLAAETERTFSEGTERYLMDNVEKSAREMGFDGGRADLRRAFLAYLDTPQAFEQTAEAHVLRAQDNLSLEDTPEVLGEKARFVADGFAVGIGLYLQLVKKIVESNWDLTQGKGANLLWDMQVAFLIGRDHTFADRPCAVVTGDRAIVSAAVAAGLGDAILDYGDYRSQLAEGEAA